MATRLKSGVQRSGNCVDCNAQSECVAQSCNMLHTVKKLSCISTFVKSVHQSYNAFKKEQKKVSEAVRNRLGAADQVLTDSLAVRVVGLLISLGLHDTLHVARPAELTCYESTR